MYRHRQQRLNAVISRLKVGSLGITALVFISGFWYWKHLSAPSQTTSVQTVKSQPILSVPQNQQKNLSVIAETSVEELKQTVGGSVNWGMYTGTMQDQVQKALADRNGPMAADLAAKLFKCDINAKQLEDNSSRGGNPGGDPAVQALRNDQLQQYQRQISACHAVGADHKQVRLQLLNVAVEQRVIGAAEASLGAGVRTPEVVRQLVGDAKTGNEGPLFQVATLGPTLLGIDEETVSTVRHALKTASVDPTVGPLVSSYLEALERSTRSATNERPSTVDYSKMSEAARKEGAEIGALLVKQLKKRVMIG